MNDLDQKSRESLVEEIEISIRKIKGAGFCSLQEYNKKVLEGTLVKKKMLEDDIKFQRENPTHPLSLELRSERIDHSDIIRRNSELLNSEIPAECLSGLHEVLFDCCAAVRVSISEALYYVGNESSIVYLNKLLEEEVESNMVKEAAIAALEECRKRSNLSNRNITFCGERGLVNSIILDMESDLKKHKAFLSSIKLTGGKSLSWVSNIETIPHYIIEPSFAMFGDPDLIIIAEEKDRTRHVIFVEAKLCAYSDASEGLISDTQLPKTYEGKASKVNIQLAFKYRFAQAFVTGTSQILVSEDVNNAKKHYNDISRYLKKKDVIDLCKRHFTGVKDFYFVALTNDNANVNPFEIEDYLPAVGKTEWSTNKNKFGILSYQMLEDAGVVSRNRGYYELASCRLLGMPADTGTSSDDIKVRTISMDKWLPEHMTALAQLAEDLRAQIPEASVEKMEGSYSIKINDRTVVKLYALESDIFIAFRNDNLPSNLEVKKMIRVGVGKNTKSFAVVYKGPEDKLNDFMQEVINFVETQISR